MYLKLGLVTALHSSKDLAVSPLHYCRIIPEGTSRAFAASVTVRTSSAPEEGDGDGRYPLPCSQLQF